MSDETPSRLLWIVWGLCCAGSALAGFVLMLFGAMFLRPHAFGARDGQGAAALALAVLLGSALSLLVTGGGSVLLAKRLSRRSPMVWLASLVAPATASMLGLVAGLLG